MAYLRYAQEHEIPTEFDDYSAAATREEFAAVLAAALPKSELNEINAVEDGAIPDENAAATVIIRSIAFTARGS